MESFPKGRDFAAWLGLTPRRHAMGGKVILGRMSKMGQRDIRRSLIAGAMAVVRWAVLRGANDPGLAELLQRKPRLFVAVALVNRMARTIRGAGQPPRFTERLCCQRPAQSDFATLVATAMPRRP